MLKLALKFQRKKLAIAAGFALILFTPFFIYLARSPVIIVTDQSSVPLYGEARIRRETRNASFALLRKVKTVSVADDAGNDIVRFAIAEASSSPYCVIFPLRFARAARLYRENNSKTPVVILQGKYENDDLISVIGGSQNDYFIYKTDIEDEFRKAGTAASILDMGKNGKIAVFLAQDIQSQAGNAFLRAVSRPDAPLDTLFFTSFDDFHEIPDLSCAVIAGTGIEFLGNNAGIPVIFLTWIDPSLMPYDVVVIINDSPWVQAVQAVRMTGIRAASGLIKSEFLIINNKNIDGGVLRKLKKIS